MQTNVEFTLTCKACKNLKEIPASLVQKPTVGGIWVAGIGGGWG